jgi:hypothetical protein
MDNLHRKHKRRVHLQSFGLIGDGKGCKSEGKHNGENEQLLHSVSAPLDFYNIQPLCLLG